MSWDHKWRLRQWWGWDEDGEKRKGSLKLDRHVRFEHVLVAQFSSVQSLSRVWLFATPLIAACQASLSITNSRSSLRLTAIKSVVPSSHVILCHPLLLLPPIPPSITVFSNESTLHMRWRKYWSFSKVRQLYGGLNGDALQEGLCRSQVCCTQSPCPCSGHC